MSNYLTDDQIKLMADVACGSYEMTASWSAARQAAFEYAVDEFGIRPRKSACLLALKHAKVQWMEIQRLVQLELGA